MQKYRIAKCLYQIDAKAGQYNSIVQYAITEDGERHRIYKTEDGKEYFYIDNNGEPLRDDVGKTGLRNHKLFDRYIRNAVEDVRNGDAHVLDGNPAPQNVFESGLFAVWFLDEVYGEQLRKEFIEDWKNAEFGYGVKYGSKYSFGPGRYITFDGTTSIFGEMPAFFESEDAAYVFMRSFVTNARDLAHEVAEDPVNISKIADKAGNFIIEDLMFDFLEDEVINEETGETRLVVHDDPRSRYIHLTQMVKPAGFDEYLLGQQRIVG